MEQGKLETIGRGLQRAVDIVQADNDDDKRMRAVLSQDGTELTKCNKL